MCLGGGIEGSLLGTVAVAESSSGAFGGGGGGSTAAAGFRSIGVAGFNDYIFAFEGVLIAAAIAAAELLPLGYCNISSVDPGDLATPQIWFWSVAAGWRGQG